MHCYGYRDSLIPGKCDPHGHELLPHEGGIFGTIRSLESGSSTIVMW